MQARKKNFDLLQMMADSDPESAEIVAEIRRDYATGKLRDQPWRWDQCRSWLDAWLYVFRRCRLDYSQHLAWKDEQVVCAVWVGRGFDDRVIDWLERFRGRFGVDAVFPELRLIETRVSSRGLARLHKLFPRAKITEYSRADVEVHPELGYAGA